MQFASKLLVRTVLYSLITYLGYHTGLIRGKNLYYDAGQLTGCSRLAKKVNNQFTKFRCVMVRDKLALEITDSSSSQYYLID